MAQKKETQSKIANLKDLPPKKDAKGGSARAQGGGAHLAGGGGARAQGAGARLQGGGRAQSQSIGGGGD